MGFTLVSQVVPWYILSGVVRLCCRQVLQGRRLCIRAVQLSDPGCGGTLSGMPRLPVWLYQQFIAVVQPCHVFCCVSSGALSWTVKLITSDDTFVHALKHVVVYSMLMYTTPAGLHMRRSATCWYSGHAQVINVSRALSTCHVVLSLHERL